MVEGETSECSARAKNRPPENWTKDTGGTDQKAASRRSNKANGHGKEKTRRPGERNIKKTTEEPKHARSRVRSEENPAISRMKKKRTPLELSKESIKKPRTHLGMHMLESVQVFQALGKKNDRKTRPSASQAVQMSGSTTELRPCPASTSQLGIPHEGKGPEKTQGTAQNPESTAEKESPSSSQDQLPPPGKVKLVPLPFLSLDEPKV